jgi:hypothetical protein
MRRSASAMRAWGPARAVAVGIGAVGPMHLLSLRVVVENAGVTLVVLSVARIGIGTETGTEIVMEDDSGMREIDDRPCLGENRRLGERRGTDGHCLVLVLVLVRHQGGGGGRLCSVRCFEKINWLLVIPE